MTFIADANGTSFPFSAPLSALLTGGVGLIPELTVTHFAIKGSCPARNFGYSHRSDSKDQKASHQALSL